MKITEDDTESSLIDYNGKSLDEFAGGVIEITAKIPASKVDKLQEQIEDDKECDAQKNRNLVGKFMFTSNTARPDITYDKSKFSSHLITMMIRYTANFKDVVVYSGANFAISKDPNSRTGVMFIYTGRPVLWTSKTQAASSTLFANMIALFETFREGIWIRRSMDELKIKRKDEATQLWCDNTGSIKTVNNIGFHEVFKHDEVKCGFIQEKILERKIKVSYVRTKDIMADMFTESLASYLLKDLIKLSGMKYQERLEC